MLQRLESYKGFNTGKYRSWRKFDNFVNRDYIIDDELEQMTRNIRMPGIVSLDMASPLLLLEDYCTLYRALSFMVPNLQQLDLSHTGMSFSILRLFAARCPRLEIIRWNCSDNEYFGIDAMADYEVESMNNLKEFYFDNWLINFNHVHLIDEDGDYFDRDDDGNDNDGVTEIEAMSDSNNYPNIFLFHGVCKNKPLERISIQNARYVDPNKNEEHTSPQQILMKFVCYAPSTLVWFRSDLSSENIRILQSERSRIQFLQ